MRVDMNTTRVQPSSLITAAVIATAVRLLSNMIGSTDGQFLERSIVKMGLSIIVLEICIVILRFFTVFRLVGLTFTVISPNRVWPSVLVVVYGVAVSLL
eukprot:5999304-Pleurochrysis_carterae.AAC.1